MQTNNSNRKIAYISVGKNATKCFLDIGIRKKKKNNIFLDVKEGTCGSVFLNLVPGFSSTQLCKLI